MICANLIWLKQSGSYKPTLQQYFDNAWISVSGPVILVHAYILVTRPIIKEELESLLEYDDIIRWSSTIIRLVNDVETSVREQQPLLMGKT